MRTPSVVVDLLRHGACAGGEIYRGRSDVALSELGLKQMQAAVLGLHWQSIISSPLQRCDKFAQGLAT